MSKIKDSGQIALDFLPYAHSNDVERLSAILRNFAKSHVKEAISSVNNEIDEFYASYKTDSHPLVPESVVENAYPLTNIK